MPSLVFRPTDLPGGFNDLQRKVAAALARHFTDLTDEELEQILNLLEQKQAPKKSSR